MEISVAISVVLCSSSTACNTRKTDPNPFDTRGVGMPYEEEKQAAKLDAPGTVEMTVNGSNMPIQDMTPVDVGQWLDDQGLGDLSAAFVRHKITGKSHHHVSPGFSRSSFC